MLSPTQSSLCRRAARAIPLFVVLFLPPALTAQNRDIPGKDYAYTSETIAALHHIADSLQSVFDALPSGQPIISDDQTIGSFVHLRGDSTAIAEAGRALDDGASFDEIIARFPTLLRDVRREVVITRRIEQGRTIRGVTYDGNTTYCATTAPEYSGYRYFNHTPSNSRHALRGSWIVLNEEMIDEPRDSMPRYRSLEAFGMPRRFARVVIPEQYARMMRYVDFMADTSTPLFLLEDHTKTHDDDYGWRKDGIHAMLALPQLKSNPSQPDDDTRYQQWTRECDARYAAMTHNAAFIAALDSTAEAGIREDVADMELMIMVERCMPNARGLELIRRLPSFRTCSRTPDNFKLGCIARLAASTLRWNIFLKAHLYVLGAPDAFEPSPQGPPSAYTHELEAIGLDVPSLLLGMWLISRHPTPNHVWIDEHRAAMTMREACSREKIEDVLLAAMKDRTLDDFNRWRAYDLYLSYIVALPSILRTARLADLRSCGDELPGYIREHLLSIRFYRNE